ncbi:unnamed protein product [Auanema sp. JU1783]|nr:unnamed protein product [Auanema sp. JU1783]
MANDTLNIPYKHHIVLPFASGINSEYIKSLYEQKWHYTAIVGILYMILIKYLQNYMKQREAIHCKTQLIAWNAILATFSLVGLARSVEEMLFVLNEHSFYHSICYTFHQDSVSAHWYFFFSLSKVWELGDTVFLALRKKHLSFLHCYHHVSVLIYTFQSGSESLAAGRWFIFMNFAAHSAMYTYYTLTSMGYKPPKNVSASVTMVQITQMIGGVIISCIVLGLKLFTSTPCQQTNFNLMLCFSIYISYFYLFMKFFNNAYLSNGKKTKKD